MIKILDQEKARQIWDSNLLLMINPTYYQSYNNSEICKDNSLIEYIYATNDFGQMKIMGFVKVNEDKVSIPFGPIFNSECNFVDVMDFISDIKEHYHKKVVFSLPVEFVNERLADSFGLNKGWFFATPLVETNKSISEVVQNCNENRRRIIRKVLKNISEEQVKTGSAFIEPFFELYKRRMTETGAKLDLSLELLQKMFKYNNTGLTVCFDNDKLIAGSITFEFGDTLITRYNCYDSDYFKISPIARVDYELLKYATNSPELKFFDMSGLAVGEDISEKEKKLNRYKMSYRPKKILMYQWFDKN